MMFSIPKPELLQIAEKFGTPTYVYDLDHIRQRVKSLRQALPDFEISYAMKSNPNPTLLKRMRDR